MPAPHRMFAAFLLVFATLSAWTPSGRADELDGIAVIYDKPSDLIQGPAPRICLLDTEHPDVVRDDLAKKDADHYKNRLFRKDLERLSGVRCVLLHYTQVTHQDFLTNSRVRAMVITARRKSINQKYSEELLALIRETEIPTLGICGAHQYIAQAYGGNFEHMRKLKPGESDPNPAYHPGVFKEWGFMNINLVRPDPLFEGLGDTMMIREFHAFEVTQLPDVFDILASTAECRVQVIKHKEKPLYGTQFHPERYDAEHPDGELLLKNFLRVAGLDVPDRR